MSSKKISQLVSATNLTGTVYVAVVQDGINKKADPSLFGGSQNLSNVLSIGNDGGGMQISNIADPTSNQDVVTLAYFNANLFGGTLTGPNTIIGTSSNILKYVFNSLGTTQTDGAGAWYQNSTAATNGNQQISPLFTQEGQGFATGVNNSQSVKFAQDVLPVQAATNPSATWRLRQSINGVAYANVLTVGSDGTTSIINGSNSIVLTPTNGVINFTANINIQNASQNRLQINSAGGIVITQSSQASVWTPSLTSIVGPHTGMTASTEFISRDFRGATQTWIDGTTATQRFNYFRGYTVSKTTTSAIFTDIYNVYIDQSAFNTGVTFTNNWALGVNGNMKILDGFNIGFGTTIGTIIGMSTQKLSFWGKTPIVQPTTAIGAATRVGGGGTTITDTDTFGGYTLAKLAAVIINSGLAA